MSKWLLLFLLVWSPWFASADGLVETHTREIQSKPEPSSTNLLAKTNNTELIEKIDETDSINETFPIINETTEVLDDLDDSNITYQTPAFQINDSLNFEAGPTLKLSPSTVSWLEAFMLPRSWVWLIFNHIFLVVWLICAVFALYRLLGLQWCSSLLCKSLYLVVHLLIFLGATFNVVQLLHLCYGGQGSIPLFLTLLLTHTPALCLATCCILMFYRVLAIAKVPVFKMALLAPETLSIVLSCILFISFIGDIVVGVTHSSIVLLVFRLVLVTIYILALSIYFICYDRVILAATVICMESNGDLKTVAMPGDRSREESPESRSHLKRILKNFALLILGASISGIVMCICNFSLSLFFTISNVSLGLFWFLHVSLFVSQVSVVICLTIAATMTLVNVNDENLLRRYFIPNIRHQGSDTPFVKHGNFVYQQVSNGQVTHVNPGFPVETETHMQNNEVNYDGNRPRINVRRSATFNCPAPPLPHLMFPQSVESVGYPVLSDHLLPTDPRARYQGRLYYRRPPLDGATIDEAPSSPSSKYPVMGCHGRIRYGSLRSLPNGSPYNRVEKFDHAYTQEAEMEPFIQELPSAAPKTNYRLPYYSVQPNHVEKSTEKCVKEIILENANLFRSHSQRNSDARRGLRTRTAIKTTVHSPVSKENGCSPSHALNPNYSHLNDKENQIIHNNSTSTIFPKVEPYASSNLMSSYGKNIHNENTYAVPHSPTMESNKELNPKTYVTKYWDTSPLLSRAAVKPHINGSSVTSTPGPTLELKQMDEEPPYCEPLKENRPEQPKSEVYVSEDFNASTLPCPKRQSLKRNHSSVGYSCGESPKTELETHLDPAYDPKLKYPWYGTWGGRRAKKRFANAEEIDPKLGRLSGSKGSLSSLYGRIISRKSKSSLPEPETLELNTPETVIDEPVEKIEEVEEPLPKLEDDIDLASEILKSSSILANFLSSKSEAEVSFPLTPVMESTVEGS